MLTTLILVSGLLLGQAAAEEEEPRLETELLPSIGQSLAKGPGWSLLEIRVANPGKKEADARLRAEVVPQGRTSPVVRLHETRLKLPPGSRRTIRLPVYRVYRWGEQSPIVGTDIRIFFDLQGYPGVADLQTIGPHEEKDDLILAVTPTGSGLAYMGRRPRNWTIDDEQDVRRWSRFALSVTPEAIPPDAVALRTFDAVVLSRIALWDLSVAQQEALLGYVSAGGNLVVATAAQGVPHTQTSLDPYLPAIPRAIAQIDGFRRLERLFSDGRGEMERVQIQRLEVRDPRAFRLYEGGHPVWVDGHVGSGRIAVVAFDILGESIPDWKGKDALVEWLLYGPRAMPTLPGVYGLAEPPLADVFFGENRDRGGHSVDRFQLEPPLEQVAREARPWVPETAWVARLILAYLFLLVPVNYTFWRTARRLDLAWPTAIVLALVTTGAVFVIGGRELRPPFKVWELDIEARTIGSPARRHIYRFALHSQDRREIDIDVEPGLRIGTAAMGQKVRGGEETRNEFTLSADPGFRDLQFRPGDYLFVDGERIDLEEGVPVEGVQETPERWEGLVHLGWEGDLAGAILFTADGWAAIPVDGWTDGALPVDVPHDELSTEDPGVSRDPRSSIAPPDLPTGLEPDDAWNLPLLGVLRKAIFRDDLRDHSATAARIVAWQRHGTTQLRPGADRVEAQGLRIGVVDVPRAARAWTDDGVVWVPKLRSYSEARRRSRDRSWQAQVEMIPVRDVAAADVEEMHFQMHEHRGAGGVFQNGVGVDGFDYYQALVRTLINPDWDIPDRRQARRLQPPQALLDPQTAEARLHLRLEWGTGPGLPPLELWGRAGTIEVPRADEPVRPPAPREPESPERTEPEDPEEPDEPRNESPEEEQ